MLFSVRVTNHQSNLVVNMCDAPLLGKNIIKNKLNLNISKSYYGERMIQKEEAVELLKNSSVINMVGKETISLSVSLGFGSHNGVKEIDGVPFLIVYKM